MACGHNGKPLDIEATILTIHLDLAGFITTRNDATTSLIGVSPVFEPIFSETELKKEPNVTNQGVLNEKVVIEEEEPGHHNGDTVSLDHIQLNLPIDHIRDKHSSKFLHVPI